MKINIKSVMLGMVLLLLTSCEEYLKIDYYDILPGDHMFLNEANAYAGLIGCYDTFWPTKSGGPSGVDLARWGFDPQIKISNHPTLDTQASGWDKMWNTQDWNSEEEQFRILWMACYRGINRTNEFLEGLKNMDDVLFAKAATKQILEAEARAIRAHNYLNLVKNFGRIPMLATGETYSNTPNKQRPETDEGTWKVIEEDLSFAAGILEWTPVDNKYGRITKGFCLAFLAEAYMWQGKYQQAKPLFEQIINSGTYELLPCYSYLFDESRAWTREDVWALIMWGNDPNQFTSWSPNEDHYITAAKMTASTEYGGWGSLFVSWEYYDSFENGDRRKIQTTVALGDTHPWTGQVLGKSTNMNTPKIGEEFMPNVSTTKFWRRDASGNLVNNPCAIRHVRYSHILLNYAETCFNTGDEPNGWAAVNKIRNRAWGNLEVTLDHPDYQIPMLKETVEVPDAQTFYTAYKALKGYSTSAGILAVNMERRHEHNSEFSFFYDLKRTKMIGEFINIEYPKNVGTPNTQPDAARQDKRTYRTFEHSDYKMIFPIPHSEILTNKGIEQNEGY